MAKIYFIGRVEPLVVREGSTDVSKAMEKIQTGNKTYVHGLTSLKGEKVFFILEQVQYIAP